MARTVVNKTVETIDTPHVQIVYRRAEKGITAYDKDDQFNEPACYTTKKRNIEHVWTVLTALHASRGDAMQASMSAVGMPYHYWCRMD